MGIYAPRAVHQASDSMAYVKKANKILDGSYDRRRRKKPWGLQKDGDLWKIWYEAARHKSRNSIKVSWTKGHATKEQVEQGITTEFNRVTNDISDKVADMGIKEGYEEGLLELAT